MGGENCMFLGLGLMHNVCNVFECFTKNYFKQSNWILINRTSLNFLNISLFQMNQEDPIDSIQMQIKPDNSRYFKIIKMTLHYLVLLNT